MTAGKTAAVTAAGGNADVSGNVTATDAGDAGGASATVTATGGDALVSGTVSAGGRGGSAKVESTDQAAEVSGTVEATGENGTVAISAKAAVDVNDAAQVTAGKDVNITAGTDAGDLTVSENAVVTANNGNVAIANQNGDVTVQDGATVSAKGDDGSVDIDAVNGGVTVDDATVQSQNANVTLDADASVTVSGASVVTGNNVGLSAKTGVALEDTASVTTTGDTAPGKGNLRLHTEDGGIALGAGTTVAAAANVTVLADKGDVAQNTGVTANDGTVDVEATSGSIVMADGTATTTAGRNVRYRASGDITVEKIDAGNGSVTLDADGNLATASSDSKVTADGLAVKAHQVGAADAKMQLDVARLAVDSATGVYVDNARSVTVTTAGGDAFKVVRVQPDFSNGSVQSDAINGVAARDGEVDFDVAGNLEVADGSSITASGEVDVDATGSVAVNGTVSAGTTADIDAGTDVTVAGSVTAGGNVDVDAGRNVTVTGAVTGKGSDNGDTAAVDITAGNNVTVDNGGRVEASHPNGSVRINAKGETTDSGITIGDGTITAGREVTVSANGNLAFTNVGEDSGKLTGNIVNITVGGDITQTGASVGVQNGYAEVNEGVLPAIEATEQITLTAGGNIGGAIGSDRIEFVAVKAPGVAATAQNGNVSIAAAQGEALNINGGVRASGTASVYTTKRLTTSSGAVQGYDVVVTAHDYSAGTVNIAAGRRLTVNNLADGMNPGLAIFKTAGGDRDPKVSNLPNNTLVFIDGRLAGGDIQMINKLGSLEAFPVQTPELKSEQGVFGNPYFLHLQLDVANPLAIGAIDFILQDRALLELDAADFPRNVDNLVDIVGLSPETSVWFGQEGKGTETGASGTGGDKEKKAKKEAK